MQIVNEADGIPSKSIVCTTEEILSVSFINIPKGVNPHNGIQRYFLQKKLDIWGPVYYDF